MASLESRITAMESSHGQRSSIYDFTTGELEAILAPEFGGSAPTTLELQAFLKRAKPDARRNHGIDR